MDQALSVLEKLKGKVDCKAIVPDPNVVKVSIVGMGMRSHAGVAQTMFAALAEKGINIQVISTSEIKVSVLLAEEYTELAVRTLHTAFGLDAA
jgi:aspartate kinase